MSLEQPGESLESAAAATAEPTNPAYSLFGPRHESVSQGATGDPGDAAEAAEGDDIESVLAPEGEADPNAPPPDETPPVEETEEVEIDGKTYKVPKDLKDGYLRQSDYTRKTQEVAEHRRAVDNERQQLQQFAQFQQEHIKEYASLTALDERLALFQNVNWQAEMAQDQARAQALHIEFTQLQAKRGQLVSALTQKYQQQSWSQQQESARREQEALAVVQREIKDWSPEKSRALETYARTEGINTDDLRKFLLFNPAIVKVLDKAAKYDQEKSKPQPKPPPKPLPKPVTKVGGGGATNTKALSDLSPEEWAARRNERRNTRR